MAPGSPETSRYRSYNNLTQLLIAKLDSLCQDNNRWNGRKDRLQFFMAGELNKSEGEWAVLPLQHKMKWVRWVVHDGQQFIQWAPIPQNYHYATMCLCADPMCSSYLYRRWSSAAPSLQHHGCADGTAGTRASVSPSPFPVQQSSKKTAVTLSTETALPPALTHTHVQAHKKHTHPDNLILIIICYCICYTIGLVNQSCWLIIRVICT